ncbi:hypothetical protein FRB94_006121 [Tulasnella sp. JGI-2019a]|nr:hypothetical protein FRB94_006121 [Tulasnella sp. JGI-2019a]
MHAESSMRKAPINSNTHKDTHQRAQASNDRNGKGNGKQDEDGDKEEEELTGAGSKGKGKRKSNNKFIEPIIEKGQAIA